MKSLVGLFVLVFAFGSVSSAKFAVGEEVLYGSYSAKITGIFSDGMSLKFSNRIVDTLDRTHYSPKTLAKKAGCSPLLPSVCVDSRFILFDQLGTVKGIFSDGTVAVLFDFTNGVIDNRRFDPRELASRKGCSSTSDGFCVDKMVKHGSTLGLVRGIYPDGTIAVQFKWTSVVNRFKWDARDLELVSETGSHTNFFEPLDEEH